MVAVESSSSRLSQRIMECEKCCRRSGLWHGSVRQIILCDGFEKATNRRVFGIVSAKMRNVWQHPGFSIDRFDQTAYAFRHNGNVRPALLPTVMARTCGYPNDRAHISKSCLDLISQ